MKPVVETCRRRIFLGLAICLLGSPGQLFSQTNLIVLNSDGAWTWYNDPRALFHNGILYFGYVRSDGRTTLSAFNPESGARADLWTSTLTQSDDHNNPGLLVREDGTLLALYARHGSDQFFSYRWSTSTNPVSPADWSAEQRIPNTGANVTYANPYQLANEGGLVYDFTRDLNFNPTVLTSTNGGTYWSAPQLFIGTGGGGVRPYVKYSSDYLSRIDFLYTDGHPRDVANSLYHFYYQSGAIHQTDGTLVKNFSALPVQHDSGERGSVIYQYSAAPSTDPNEHISTGRAWCWEVVRPTNGNPVCVFTVQRDQVMGPSWSDSRIYYYYARWTGSTWQKRFIAHAGRPLYQSEADYAGGICVDPQNPNVIYISSNAQNPFDLSDINNVPLRANNRYELYRGVTADGGLTFSWETITTNSASDNLRPYIPRHQSGSPVVIWFRGVYSTYTVFDTEVVGLFHQPVPDPPEVSITNPLVSPVVFSNLNNQIKLQAEVIDDGQPQPASVAWTTTTGPAPAIFSNPSNQMTTARFSVPGTYVLRVSADDTIGSSFSETTVLVGPAPGDQPDATRVLWLKLDESGGTSAADSAGANHGTASGNFTWQLAGGVRAGAINFDGSSGQIVVPDAPALDNTSAFTLAYWFNANTYPADSAGLVCKRNNINDNNAYTTYLKTSDQRIYVDVNGNNNRFASSTLINTGQWYHVAIVFNGTLPANERVTLWINGALDVTANETSASIPDFTSAVRIGNTHPGAANWFNGRVDDVRFYRRALSASEIGALAVTNQSPSVAPGEVSPATNGVPVNLNGSAVDDGKGGTLTVTWSAQAGPGTAMFADANSASTAVTFNKSGVYTLRLAASDSQVEAVQDVNVTVHPNPDIFADWVLQFFPGETNVAVIGGDVDFEGDGLANFAEFAIGLNPAMPDAMLFGDQGGLPRGGIGMDGGENYLLLLLKRPIGRMGVSYEAEVSGNLHDWNSAVQMGTPTDNGDGTELVIFRDVVPVDEAGERYIRLRITGS